MDTHLHLMMDAATLARQTLDSSATEALHGLATAQHCLRFGFTTLHDLAAWIGIPDRRPTQRVERRAGAGAAADRLPRTFSAPPPVTAT
jgi:hypothetical protein